MAFNYLLLVLSVLTFGYAKSDDAKELLKSFKSDYRKCASDKKADLIKETCGKLTAIEKGADHQKFLREFAKLLSAEQDSALLVELLNAHGMYSKDKNSAKSVEFFLSNLDKKKQEFIPEISQFFGRKAHERSQRLQRGFQGHLRGVGQNRVREISRRNNTLYKTQ